MDKDDLRRVFTRYAYTAIDVLAVLPIHSRGGLVFALKLPDAMCIIDYGSNFRGRRSIKMLSLRVFVIRLLVSTKFQHFCIKYFSRKLRVDFFNKVTISEKSTTLNFKIYFLFLS